MSKGKAFQDLTIVDGFMFGAVMEDPELCRMLLERILEIPIRKVEVEKEKTLQYHPDYKGIRMDVLAKDEKGTRFNVEMQVQTTPVGQRSRYYHSQMDMDLLLKGTLYNKLPKAYVIFICDYKPFPSGKYRYTFENHCREVPGLQLEDGLQTIVLSNRGNNPDEVPRELAAFLEYTKRAASRQDTVSDDKFVRQIEDRIHSIKRDRNMEERYMQLELLLQEMKEEGRKEEEENTRKERERADKAEQRADDEKQRADGEKQRADDEKQRADEAERRVKELELIIKDLKEKL